MNLSRCENGHFFDKEKFVSCPHCANGAGRPEANDRTMAFIDDSDVMSNKPFTPEASMGASVTPTVPESGISASATIPEQQPMTPVIPIPETELVSNVTETVGVPVDGNVETDDDNTVAYYDDLFADVKGNVPEAVVTPINSAAPVRTIPPKNRVSSPCVGWLVALNGGHIGQDFRLKAGKNFIGRDNKMDVVLDGDKSVSRNKHAIVVYEPKQHMYLVQAGESSELVYHNNTVVLTPTQLQPYDVITVGEVDLLFMSLCGEKFTWESILKHETKD